MVVLAQQKGLVTGQVPHLLDKGIAVLHYADDTILCLEENLGNVRNIKLLLYLYELMSGLRINFQKSEIVLIGGDDMDLLPHAELLNCQIGHLPMKYLGVSVSHSRLHVVDSGELEERILKKPVCWQGGS